MAEDVRLFLFYDPACGLCRRFKALIQGWDRRGQVGLVAFDDPSIPARFPHLDQGQMRQQLTVYTAAGRIFVGAEALVELGKVLPGVGRLAWAYRLPGVAAAAKGAYRAVNRRRPCLNCGEKWLPSRKYSRRKRGR